MRRRRLCPGEAVFLGACAVMATAVGAAPGETGAFAVQRIRPELNTVTLQGPKRDAGGVHTWWARPGPCPRGRKVGPPTVGNLVPDTPEGRWFPVPVPGNLLKHADFVREWAIKEEQQTFCYRKAFVLPAHLTHQPAVRLGIITDRDRVFLNGDLIAEHGAFESSLPEAYDRIRLVALPLPKVLPGVNVLHVEVRSYFPHDAGILQDRVAVGRAEALRQELDRETLLQIVPLACYLAVGGYFLFLFARRRRERENLYFGLFCLGLVIYQILRTHLKYDLALSFFPWKRFEYLVLLVLSPFWYYFVRAFFEVPGSRLERQVDRLAHLGTLASGCFAILILAIPDVVLWNSVNQGLVQFFVWPVHVLGTVAIMARRAIRPNRDAQLMLGAFAVVLVALGLDILASRNILNLPRLLGYAFLIFILAQAGVLANRFVLVNEQAEDLSANLERKVSERTDELQSAYQKLRELDQVKTNFFANVSHELRTPLTLILTPLESMQSGELGSLTPLQKEFLQSAQGNGQKLLRQINNLLDFSRIEAGGLSLNLRRLDFAQFVAELASALESAARSAGLKLVVTLPGEPVPASFDPEKMEKVVLNLLSNAFKFTEHGEIRVEVIAYPDRVGLRVRDTGIGIPPEQLESVFDRFHQVDASSKRRFEGTGIGLALARELAVAHGGLLRAEHVAQGASLYLEFPRGSVGQPATTIPSGPRQSSSRGALLADLRGRASASEEEVTMEADDADGERSEVGRAPADAPSVLIVEDTRDMRKMLLFLLRPHFRVSTARNGRAGLERARHMKPDVIVSDVMMPDMNGYELVQAIRADTDLRTTPVILLSARADVTMRIEGLDQGADDYLVKPFHARELLARVRAQVRMHSLQAEVAAMRDRLQTLNDQLTGQLQVQVSELLRSERFRDYLPPQLVSSILGRSGGGLRSERKLLTIFFSDIVDFTRTTDELEPEALSALLNDYLSEMTRIAKDHGAFIDKFIGDAILCHFGAFESRGESEDARACVRMAVAMQRRMKELGEEWIGRGYEEPLRIRCGITTGYAAVGNFGSNERLDFTVIGTQVNLASRIQAAAEPGEVRISHATWALVRRDFETEPAGSIEPKGLKRSFATYRVLM